ncbi:MAG TPA: thiamine pyrophosphate-binding protein [Thermoanaerobaculia bacterium]|nr:thiamine pyrophosphate-binding protein [Thermoanaerobaculia bacterium]
MNGGELVAEVLARHGVRAVFTLCGGHISPILVGCARRGIRVIDTRHEAAAVFAADAVSRLTGVPGVAVVTAGPGVTNTITAVTNARLAQSPLVLLGGAAAGILKGRGALQDIDQLVLVRSQMKWSAAAKRVSDIPRLLTTAFERSRGGVPGPVFLELPIDLLYDEALVREWFERSGGGSRLLQWYMSRYLRRLFGGTPHIPSPRVPGDPVPGAAAIRNVAARLARAQRPVVLVGSQAVADPAALPRVAAALEQIGAPVFLSGMSRGLLGAGHRQHIRHRRKEALRQADLVILAGVPADFRLNYGRDIGRGAVLISANRSAADLKKNRRPEVALHGDPGAFLIALAAAVERRGRDAWLESLRTADSEREREIDAQAKEPVEDLNPLALCQAIDRALDAKSVIVADGGDFVSTASYIVRPRAPLSWLDPGPFGTLGVGGGFALGAAVSRPGEELWILYGDGALGFSLAEFDTFARHRIPVIAVVANDGCWSQIHREQVEILGDDTGCMLARAAYHVAAEGLGGRGLLLREPGAAETTLREAKRLAAEGHPVLVNAWIGKTAFRKGSISM